MDDMNYNIAVFVPGAIAPYRFMNIYNFTIDQEAKLLEFWYEPEPSTKSQAIFTYTGYILERVDPEMQALESMSMDEAGDIDIA